MLVLSNTEIEKLLKMTEYIDILRKCYVQLGGEKAADIPRADLMTKRKPGVFHSLKTMSGSIDEFKVGAVRINSDIVHWPEIHGNVRRVKIPAAPGNRWVGLVLLFSINTGEPLAIFPDGVVQRMRVGGTSGLAAEYLAREDAKTVGLLGSGWQAGSHAMALASVRPVKLIKVYSPTVENRQKFAETMTSQLGIEVRAVKTAEEAADADIVACTTNALQPVFNYQWLIPGMHITCVRSHEFDAQTYKNCQTIFINCKEGVPHHYLVGAKETDIPELVKGWKTSDLSDVPLDEQPELADLVTGKTDGRKMPEDITCFCNNIGLGIQFAAVGAFLLEKAREHGVGHELPLDWFVQNVHP